MSLAELGYDDDARLTIDELTALSGIKPALLRSWEKEHGFPVPHRASDGTRRYRLDQADAVIRLLRRREDGVPLAQALREARAAAAAAQPSVITTVLERFPDLTTVRTTKRALIDASYALEDECTEVAEAPLFVGMFQTRARYRPSQLRWAAIAGTARTTLVHGDFPRLVEQVDTPAPILVPIPDGSALQREWVVACEAVDFRGVLAAREVPGAQDVGELDRLFDAVWSVDPDVVRTVTRLGARAAAAAGSVLGEELVHELEDPPGTTGAAEGAAKRLWKRMREYAGGDPGFPQPA